MKKMAAFLIFIIVFGIFFTGCNKNEVVQNCQVKKEITFAAMASSTTLNSDCLTLDDITMDNKFEEWYSERYGTIKIQAPKAKETIVFQGKEYSGNFDSTVVNSLGMRTVHTYWGKDALFCLDATNGKLLEILMFHKAENGYISDKRIQQCRNEAQRIAEQYIDTNYFVLEEEKLDIGMYFTYYQFIGEIKTENKLKIGFDPQGNIALFSYSVSDGYKLVSNNKYNDSIKVAQELSSEKAQQTALNMAKNIFSHHDVNEYNISKQMLYIMPDGELVKAYSFDVKLKDKNPSQDQFGNTLYQPNHAFLSIAVFEQ